MRRTCECDTRFESLMSQIPALSVCGLDDGSHGFLMEFAAALPLIILLQIVLFLHTIYNEYILRKSRTSGHVDAQSSRLRNLYVLLQIVGLFWTIVDVVNYGQIDMRSDIACNVTAFIPKFMPTIFYGLYFIQILLRLRRSFKGSHLALRTSTFCILSVLIMVPCIIYIVVLIYSY